MTTTDSDDTSDDSPSADTTGDSAADSALKDDGGFADPQAVDPVTDKPLDSDSSDDSSSSDDSTAAHNGADPAADAPVVAAVPVAAAAIPAATVAPVATDATDAPETSAASAPLHSLADSDVPAVAAATATDSKPGSVTAPDLGSLFGADDAQSFHDRWRDVQLRFVDSPKEATSEAARLVDEAVDKLTASLKSQKEGLSGDHGEDTEKLRVELRGYRDILNRILDL